MEQQQDCQRVRFEMLVGAEALSRLRRARVAVFGLGGVGGCVVEALARAGVGALDLIDNDRVAPSNLNRQILALHSTVGMRKVDAARDRVLDIDPNITVRCFQTFYLPETRAQFDFRAYDYVVDCIDTVTAKLDLILQCRAAETPIICALGTGNKLDPTKLELTDLSKTAVCPLARVLRKELRRRGVEHLKVLYSREEPLTPLFAPPPEPAPASNADAPSAAPEREADQEAKRNAEREAWQEAGREAKQEAEQRARQEAKQTAEREAESFGNKRRSIPGSSPFVPPAAGLMIASAVVRDLLGRAGYGA